MAKAIRVACDRCETKIRVGTPYCISCGTPTEWASHEERVEWELTQWHRTGDAPHQPLPPAPKKRTTSLRPVVERRTPARVAAASAPAATAPAAELAPVTQLHADAPDEAITRTVLRALNERVRELEDRIRRMEAQPAKRSILRRR
jgi:hypothetical protein